MFFFLQLTHLRPTTLDAIAFGHLAIHAYPSLANPKLFTILSFEAPSLLSYVTRLKSSLFVEPLQKSISAPPSWSAFWEEVLTSPTGYFTVARNYMGTFMDGSSSTSPEERVETFYKWLSVVGGLAVFLAYSVKIGTLQTSYEEESDSDNI